MPIEAIFIATHKYDLRLTKICVASIRYWYPQIPIYLIKDYFNGEFSTRQIEEHWGVKVYKTDKKKFGWGLSKLEPFFSEQGMRFLVLDSDIVFVGRVLDKLEERNEDFVVQYEDQSAQRINEIYFSLNALNRFDPDFKFPNYTFNTGQIVATGGILKREDFTSLIDWNNCPPILMHPQVFKNGDQGALNYVLMSKEQRGALTISRIPFMKWGVGEISQFDLKSIANNSPYPYLIHWAGLKKNRIKEMLRADILLFFEDYYYSRLPLGSFRQNADIAIGSLQAVYQRQLRRVKRFTERLTSADKGREARS